ncbi:hypothetical protein [Psychrobacter glaciei]|uniref:hypothetical protein n=1 Tax=Psychrobacter glaciei TaxID=619771 RepID=UPI001F06764D|nr:hypothetical protein [Psychrobacter glaciei]MCH1781757.1 hypothetical protein [Psychrobacter glaciei]
MRVSFVLNADQDIDQVIENRVRVIEHNFEMEVQSFSIKQIDKVDFDCNFESLNSEEVKQAIDSWFFNPRFEIKLAFKEAGNDE